MRHAAIYFTFIVLTSIGAQSANAQIAWEGKLRDAHTSAKQQGKLMLLHFYTDNCVYCERLEAGAFRSASVSNAINQNFVAVKVHGGKNPKLAKMFKVTKYPTDVIVTTDGKALSHSVSPQQPDRYIAMLTGAQISYAKTKTMLARQKQTPAASVAVATAAPVAVERSAPAQATKPSAPGFAMPSAPEATTTTALPVQIPAPGQVPADIAPPPSPTPTTSLASTGKSRENKFLLPGAHPVNATLAGARSNGITLPAADLKAAANSSVKPDLAIQGYCAVSVINKSEWVEGKSELGVVHLGKLYLFSDQASMDLFLADPIPFTPMLNEIDVVRFFEEKQIVKGKREWGVIDPIHNRMFFFGDKATMLHFEKEYTRYLDASIEVMNHAIEESNPGV